MSYISKNLQANETIEYKSDIHWFIFVLPSVFIILGLFFYPVKISPTLHYIGLALLVLGGFTLLKRLLLKLGTEYVITNKRVILKSGFFSRDALELMINKCEGLRINQNIIGRIFGFGTILVTTGGATNHFKFVAGPMKFRNEINRLVQ